MSTKVTAVSVDFYYDSEGHGSTVTIHAKRDKLAGYSIGTDRLGFRAESPSPNFNAEMFNTGWTAVMAAEFFGFETIDVRRLTREGFERGVVSVVIGNSRTRTADNIADAGAQLIQMALKSETLAQ